MTDEPKLPKGFMCECGKYNRYPSWIYAHWRTQVDFTCDCKRMYVIVCGQAWLKTKRRKKAQ